MACVAVAAVAAGQGRVSMFSSSTLHPDALPTLLQPLCWLGQVLQVLRGSVHECPLTASSNPAGWCRKGIYVAQCIEPEQNSADRIMTPVGFEPTQLALVELDSTPLDHSGKVSLGCRWCGAFDTSAVLLLSVSSQVRIWHSTWDWEHDNVTLGLVPQSCSES